MHTEAQKEKKVRSHSRFKIEFDAVPDSALLARSKVCIHVHVAIYCYYTRSIIQTVYLITIL